jgi:nicotinamidase/pyrazinamidase
MQAALIIVDMQNDFMPGGALAIDDADKIIPIINNAMSFFSLVIAVQDSHPLGHISFASSHPSAEVYSTISVQGVEQRLWPEHCIKGTWGALLHRNIHAELIKHTVFKGEDKEVDSYSAFFDNLHKRHTGLDAYLKKSEIDTIYICGVATEYCVLYSVIDALELGYSVFVIADACKGIDLSANDDNNALQIMRKLGADIITSQELYNLAKESLL